MAAPGPVVVSAAALVGAGELLLPTEGVAGLLGASSLWFAYPAGPARQRLLHAEERRWLALLRHPRVACSSACARRAARPRPAATGAHSPEVYEAVVRDEDRAGT